MNVPHEISVNGRSFSVLYEKAPKYRSSVRIRNGEVVLKLSRYVFGPQRDKIVRDFLEWAEKKLANVRGEMLDLPEYVDGGRICTHNKAYDLYVRKETRRVSRVYLNGGVIEVCVPRDLVEFEDKVRSLVEKRIMEDQLPYLLEVLDELNQMYFQEDYGHVKFKRMNSRFGSCSSKRNLNFAYRLLFAPREVFRYVCAHELAHLKEFNHSKRFWALVAEAVPDYKTFEKWLRDNGFMLG